VGEAREAGKRPAGAAVKEQRRGGDRLEVRGDPDGWASAVSDWEREGGSVGLAVGRTGPREVGLREKKKKSRSRLQEREGFEKEFGVLFVFFQTFFKPFQTHISNF
jgi:hypothetical protein